MLLISIWFLFSSLLKVCCLYFSIAPFILCSTYTKHMHHKGDILLYTVIGRRLLSAAAKGEDHSILQTFKVLIIQNIQQLNNNQLMLNEEEEGSTFWALLQTTHGYKHGEIYPECGVGYQFLSLVSPREVTGTPKHTVDADAHKKSEEKMGFFHERERERASWV